jgi:hypothetical protein
MNGAYVRTLAMSFQHITRSPWQPWALLPNPVWLYRDCPLVEQPGGHGVLIFYNGSPLGVAVDKKTEAPAWKCAPASHRPRHCFLLLW